MLIITVTVLCIQIAWARKHSHKLYQIEDYRYPVRVRDYSEPDADTLDFLQKQCRFYGDRVSDPNQCGVYYECLQKRYAKRDMTQLSCPDNQMFDSLSRRCIGVICSRQSPSKQKALPFGWPCDLKASGNATKPYNVHPYDCTKYYTCETCEGKLKKHSDGCYKQLKSCPEGQSFDDIAKECVTVDVCPQVYLELPSEANYTCQRNGQYKSVPGDCSKYYQCIKCSKPSGWCHESGACDEGFLFDDLKETCTPTEICPQEWVQLPRNLSEWRCTGNRDSHALPGNCSQFYSCYPCNRPGGWCFTAAECPPGMTFSEQSKSCSRSRCPQWPSVLPANWTCEKEMAFKQNPENCKEYYSCVKCPDDSPWCHLSATCKGGEWFDEIQQKCVKHFKCPQEDTPLPAGEEGWVCSKQGEIHVHPKDCSKSYKCYRCSKGWCVDIRPCPLGETFDDVLDQCVPGKCPQDKLELPKAWTCKLQDELRKVPNNATGNCTKAKYKCETCSKPGGWCYTC